MNKISPFLWFDTQAEEAANYYVSIFNNSRIVSTSRYGDAGPGPKGSVMTVEFELEGQSFIALNGGPQFHFNEAVSLVIECEDQAEVDRLWDALTADGGEPGPCGWLKDRYGLSWQIVPKELNEMLDDSDTAAAGRAMEAMLQMGKIDVAACRRAFEGRPVGTPA